MADSLKTKTIRGLAWKLLERGGVAVVSLVVQIVMARLLAPEYFGALAIMLVFVNLANVFVNAGLSTAIVQLPDATEQDFCTALGMCFSIAVVLFVVLFAAAPSIAAFYSLDMMTWPMRALSLVLVIGAYNSVRSAVLSREMQFRKLFLATLSAALISGVAGVGAAIAGGGLWALVVQQLMQQATLAVLLFVQMEWRYRAVFNVQRAKTMFSFGWKLLVSGLLDTAYRGLASLIIGRMFTPSDLGYVSQGEKYPQALGTMLDGAIQPVMLSAIAKIQDDAALVKSFARRALKTSTFLVFPAMGLFALAASPLVVILLGEQWLPCVPFLQMYCFIYALLPVHTTNLQVLNGIGRSDWFLKLELVKKAYGVVFVVVAAVVFRTPVAIVAASMISNIISTFVNAWPNRKLIGYSYGEQVRDMLPSFAATLIAVAVVYPTNLLDLVPVLVLVIQIASFAAVYVVLSLLFNREQVSYLVENASNFVRGTIE